MSADSWRLLDSGLASAAQNVALSRALLEARSADEITSTLRFLRYSPSALIGSRQHPDHELDLAECAAQNVPVQRRISGGGTWFADERQLGWELYLHRRDLGAADSKQISKRVLHAAATGLSALAIDARYRPRDEIEVDGRTLCFAWHAAERNAVLLQGVLVLELDCQRIARLLKLPAAAAGHRAASLVGDRLVPLKEVLGREPDLHLVKRYLAESLESEFNVELRDGDLGLTEHSRYRKALDEIDTTQWTEHVPGPICDMRLLDGAQRVAGGVLRAFLKYDASSQVIRQVWFSGDVRSKPRRAVLDLEAALRDVPIGRLKRQVEWFFASHPSTVEGAAPADFAAAINSAVGQPLAA